MARTRVRAHWRRKRGGLSTEQALIAFIFLLAVIAAFMDTAS